MSNFTSCSPTGVSPWNCMIEKVSKRCRNQYHARQREYAPWILIKIVYILHHARRWEYVPWISMMSILTIRISCTFDSKYPHFWILDWCGYLMEFIRVVLFGFYEVIWIFWWIYSLLLNSSDWWIFVLVYYVFPAFEKNLFQNLHESKKSKMWENFLWKILLVENANGFLIFLFLSKEIFLKS